MGFLDWIFGRKKEEKFESLQNENYSSIEDIEKILIEKYEEKLKPFENANKVYDDIQNAADNLKKSLDELEKSEFLEKVDTELLHHVTTHRKSFINKMEGLIQQIKVAVKLDFDSFLEYSKSISVNIEETNQNTLNDYRYVDRLFEKQGEKVIDDFKIIKKFSDDLKNLIKGISTDISPIKERQNEINILKNEIGVSKGMKDEIDNIEIKLAEFKSEHEKESSKLMEFDASEVWLNFSDILKRKNDIENNISANKSEIIEEISKIDRPLKKLKNLVDKGNIEIDNDLLERYLDKTFDSLIDDGGSEKINSLIDNIQKNISEGVIEMKDSKKELKEMEYLLENDIFGNLLNKYIQLQNDLNEINKIIEESKEPKIRKDIESKIKYIENQIAANSSESEKIKKQIEKIQNSINENKSEMEKYLSQTLNKEMKIRIL